MWQLYDISSQTHCEILGMGDSSTPQESYPENVNTKIKFCDNLECQMEKTSATLNPLILMVSVEDLDMTTPWNLAPCQPSSRPFPKMLAN